MLTPRVNVALPALGTAAFTAPMELLVSPYQNIEQAFTTYLSAAAPFHAIIYSATLPCFFEAMTRTAPNTRVIFDHTESTTPMERTALERLQAAGLVLGRDFLIGTSPDAHAILHTKAVWYAEHDVGGPVVWQGSWNFSHIASKELNQVAIVHSADAVALWDQIFATVWQWIAAHEQYTIPVGEAHV